MTINSEPIRILCVDDHPLLRAGVVMLIETQKDMKMVGEATSGREAIELEKKKMLAEARTEIARLVIATTQRVLSEQLSEADRGRYNEAAGRELTNV